MGQRNGVGGMGLNCFVKKESLKFLHNLQEMCSILLLNKVTGSKLLKKRLRQKCFLVTFAKF